MFFYVIAVLGFLAVGGTIAYLAYKDFGSKVKAAAESAYDAVADEIGELKQAIADLKKDLRK